MKSFRPYIRATFVLALTILVLVALPLSSALAYSDGPRNATSSVNLAGVGTEVWQNPGNITTAGSPYAEVTLYHLHLVSNYLYGSGYGFAVPTDAAIVGIEVVISRYASPPSTSISDYEVRLVKAGAPEGANRAVITPWSNTLTAVTYGGPTDLWGTTWTPADVNAANFGVALSAQRDNNGNNARNAVVDTMQVTVYYAFTTTTEVACGTPVTYGDNVTCLATVTRLSGSTTPTGSVNWTTDGSGTFSPNPCTLSGSGDSATCSTTYTPSAVGDGSHLVTGTYSGDAYFTSSNASQAVVVNPRPVTVTADPQTKVYGDPDPALTYQVTSGSLAFSDTFTGTLTREAGENVGTYAIQQGTLALTPDYVLTYVGNDFTITEADPTCLVTPYDVTYDATVHTATGSCTGVFAEPLAGLDLSGTTHTNAGSYTDAWTFTDVTGNYDDATGTVVDNIGKADATCDISGYTGVYDGFFHGASGDCTGVGGEDAGMIDLGQTFKDVPGGTANWTFTGNNNYNNQSGSVAVVIDAANATCDLTGYTGVYDAMFHGASGTCSGVNGEDAGTLDLGDEFKDVPGGTAFWSFTGNSNYTDQSGSVAVTITPADATCDVNGYIGVYDALFHGASGSCTGVNGEDAGTLDLGDEFKNVPGGTADWTFTGNGNYNDQSGSVAVTITPADATCNVNGYTGVYDAQFHGASGTCSGINGEDAGTLDFGATYMDVPGGTADWTFTGNGNYNDQSGGVEVVITPADATCEVTGYTGVYDAQFHGASGTCTGVNGEDAGTLELGDTFKDVPGGPADWTFTGNGNYNDQSGSVEVVITPADATCEILGYTGVYDAQFHGASGTCTGVNGEDPGELELGDTFKDVPGGPADWTFSGNGNYNDQSGSVEVTITPADATCDVNGYTGVYDGLFHGASGTCTGVNGEDPGELELGDTFKDVPGGPADWTFTGNGNYNDQSGSVAVVITPADATCTVYGYDLTYDGNPHTATGECTGVVGEPLSGLDLSGTTHTDADSYVDTWTFTDPTGNYNDQSDTVLDNISQADATCVVTAYNVVFDMQNHLATGECTGVGGAPLQGLDLSGTEHAVPGIYTDIWIFSEPNGNYAYMSGMIEDVITKADPVCTVAPYVVEYDREAHTASGACLGVDDNPLSGLDLGGTTHTDVGTYAGDPWVFTDVTGNYNNDSGTLTDVITTIAITVSADAKTKVYGQPDPELTYQVTNGALLSGDEFSGALTRQPGETVRTYAILQGTLALPDYYTITYQGASLTITGNRILMPMVHRNPPDQPLGTP